VSLNIYSLEKPRSVPVYVLEANAETTGYGVPRTILHATQLCDLASRDDARASTLPRSLSSYNAPCIFARVAQCFGNLRAGHLAKRDIQASTQMLVIGERLAPALVGNMQDEG
jgi:hypothetical protein